MANDMDMTRDISMLFELRKIKQANALAELFSYEYGLGSSNFKNNREFVKAKKDYEKKYGSLDNYV